MKTHAQVVIIGGGIMGCSLAYHLTKFGWTDVVLLEKNELTAGSTWHAAGLCTHYAHNATMMNLRAHSVKLYGGELERDTGQAVSFHNTGALRVTCHQDRLDEFKHVRGVGEFVGHKFNILSPAELREIYPLADISNLVGAIHEPDDGYVDPSQATHAFAQGARQRGATIYRQTQVTGMHRKNHHWVVQTPGGEITCEHIVNAAGTWCREIGLMMGVDLPVVPMLHQYIVTDRINAFAALTSELPIIRDPDESWYMRQERDGIIIGPYEKNGLPWAIDGVPAEFGMELLPPELERIESIAADAMNRVPAAAEGGIKTIVNGPITFTPDANPLIGPAFGLQNAWVLTGSSMGVMEGGGAGDFLAQWMINNQPPADALAIDSRRFGDYPDRQFRVDKAVECFAAQFGIHYPFEERPAGRQKRLSPIYSELNDLNAVFGSVYGWERPNYFAPAGEKAEAVLSFTRPNWFSAVADEVLAVTERAGIADLSVFAKFKVSGTSSRQFINQLGCNRAPSPGRVNLNLVLSPGGGVLLEFTITQLEHNSYMLITAAGAERIANDFLNQTAAQMQNVEILNCTQSITAMGVMGPESISLLQPLTTCDLQQTSFPWLSAQNITIAGIPVTALRVSYVGESGWELYTAPEHQQSLFKAIWQAGLPYDLKPFGAFTMNSMRLEKGYRAWGADYTTERTPLEAGVGHFVHAEDREFAGKEAMLTRAQSDNHWQMHLLTLDTQRVDPFYLHPIKQGGRTVGVVTSGAYGHRCKQSLALCYFREPPQNTDSSESELTAEILGEAVDARMLDQAPVDPKNLRSLA